MANNTIPTSANKSLAADNSSRGSNLRERVGDAVDNARESIGDLRGSTAEQIVDSPLIALGAGVALGAVLAAVLPASQRERELLKPMGSKIAEAGTGAVDRARDLGKQKFDEMAGDKVREFFGAGTTGKA